jgi:hypothetical protein
MPTTIPQRRSGLLTLLWLRLRLWWVRLLKD